MKRPVQLLDWIPDFLRKIVAFWLEMHFYAGRLGDGTGGREAQDRVKETFSLPTQEKKVTLSMSLSGRPSPHAHHVWGRHPKRIMCGFFTPRASRVRTNVQGACGWQHERRRASCSGCSALSVSAAHAVWHCATGTRNQHPRAAARVTTSLPGSAGRSACALEQAPPLGRGRGRR